MKMIEKNNAAKDRSTMLSPDGGLVFKYSVKKASTCSIYRAVICIPIINAKIVFGLYQTVISNTAMI